MADLKPILLTENPLLAEKRRKKEILKVTGSALLGVAAGVGLLAAAPGLIPALAIAAPKILPKVGKALVPKTLKGAAAAITVGGILTTSKKARTMAKDLPGTLYKKGKTIGEIIEEPGKAEDILGIKKGMTTKEKLIEGAKKAGLVGAGAAAVVGGVAAGKKIIEKVKEKKLPDSFKELGFTDPKPVGLGGVPVAIRQPVGVTPSQAPQSQKMAQPINNIIQISVR